MHCKNCGNQIPEGNHFCSQCGAPAENHSEKQEIRNGETRMNSEIGSPSQDPVKKQPGKSKGFSQKKKVIYYCLSVLAASCLSFWIGFSLNSVPVKTASDQKKTEESSSKVIQADPKKDKDKKDESEKKKAKDWEKTKELWQENPGTDKLEQLLSFKEDYPESSEMADEWYESLWESPQENLAAIIYSADLMNRDQDIRPGLEIVSDLTERNGSVIEWKNIVHELEYPEEKRIISLSRIGLEPVITRENISFRLVSQTIPSNGAITGPDKSFSTGQEGLYGFRLIDGEYPARVEDGKLVLDIRTASPQSPQEVEPIHVVMTKDQMNLSNSNFPDTEDLHWSQAVMYPGDYPEPYRSSAVNRFMNDRSIDKPSYMEYFEADFNGDGLMDIVIRDQHTSDPGKPWPEVIFYRQNSDQASFTRVDSAWEWSSSLEYDGQDFYMNSFKQDMFAFDRLNITEGGIEMERIQEGEWNRPGMPELDYTNQLEWTKLHYGDRY